VLGQTLILGGHDTFPCQEAARLRAVVQALQHDDIGAARDLLLAAERSPWRGQQERALLWQAAQRCLQFQEVAESLRNHPLPRGLQSLIETYVETDGFWRLDRAQRLFEQAGAQCHADEEVEAAIERCRSRYSEVAGRLQAAFQAAVQQEGWPPEGQVRQTQTFDSHVARDLAERRKVAFILVDSLRYEMGRDLAEALREVGEVRITAAATVLPTTTPCGMAALLPGADGAFRLVAEGVGLEPAIGETILPNLHTRKALLAARYGDRMLDLTVEEALQTSQTRLQRQVAAFDLLLLRSRDIDSLGEGPNLFQARRLMSEVVGDLRTLALRLAGMGFQKLIFAADHGHVLIPEIPPGDALTTPPGRWLLKKRRSLLGAAQGQTPGVLLFPARAVGINGPIEEFAAAAGFKTFGDVGGYFHEGLSLQECIVPVLTVQTQRMMATASGAVVTIAYRSDRFTSAVVGLKLRADSMLARSVAARLEAFDGPGVKAKAVGQAGDCDARNPATGEVTLPVGEEVPIPLVVDPDFQGRQIEVRAVDPTTGVVLGRLTLQNARMD